MRLGGTRKRGSQPKVLHPCSCGCGVLCLQKYATRACVPKHANRGRAKALPSQQISLGRTRKQKATDEAARESWWTCYAQGERRDGFFMAEAERRFLSGSTTTMVLKEWVA